MDDAIFEPARATALRLDEEDELAPFREAFVIDDPGLIYLNGNSLGRLPMGTRDRLLDVMDNAWGKNLIRSWNEGWLDAPVRVGEKIARLVGAKPGQVIVGDCTSINLFKLVMAALAMRPARGRLVSDTLNFPSDLHVLEGIARLMGDRARLHLVHSPDGITMDQDALLSAIDRETAVVTLSHVAFKSGYLYDMEAITRRAHEQGALVVWDLSHSAGVVPVELDRLGVDMAVGCTYKYLNGGPGAPAFLYVRRDLQKEAESPIPGWFGRDRPFDFDLDHEPAKGMTRFLTGTPPILSLLALEPALDLLLEAGMDRIRRKSTRLTSYLIDLADAVLEPLGFTLGSPRDAAMRGSHVSIRHLEGYRISRALIEEMHVIPDFRSPDHLRLGLSPLYTSFADVLEAVDRIRKVVEDKAYEKYSADRPPVT